MNTGLDITYQRSQSPFPWQVFPNPKFNGLALGKIWGNDPGSRGKSLQEQIGMSKTKPNVSPHDNMKITPQNYVCG